MMGLWKLPVLCIRAGCCYWLCVLVVSASPQPSVYFFSAVPTPCGGYGQSQRKTPFFRLPASQRRRRIANWFLTSSYSVVNEIKDDDASLEEEEEEPLPLSTEKLQEDGTTVTTLVDPYDTWWNGKVSLYKFLRKTLDDRFHHQLLVVDDPVDEVVDEIIITSTKNSKFTKSAGTFSFEESSFILSPRILATNVCLQMKHCFYYLQTLLFPQADSTPKEQHLKFRITLDFERMYVGFAVIFFLHYFYLLRIVMSRSSVSHDSSKKRPASTKMKHHHYHNPERKELLLTLDEVAEDDGEEDWGKSMEQDDDEDILGRELHLIHLTPSPSFRKGPPLSSVATATTMDAFSFLEDSDDEDSTSSSSVYSFPSRYAAADWYYHQPELMQQQHSSEGYR